jgi:hypothetical protein
MLPKEQPWADARSDVCRRPGLPAAAPIRTEVPGCVVASCSSLHPAPRVLSDSEAGPGGLPWPSRLQPAIDAVRLRDPTRRCSLCCGPRPGPAPCGAAGVLPDSSHGVRLKDCPSIDIQRVRPLRARYRPCQAGCPADWTRDRLGLRLLDRFGFVARLRPRLATPGLVPSLPFLTASTAYSAHAAQVCCTLQPIMGFAWLQATSRSWIHTVHSVRARPKVCTSVLDSAPWSKRPGPKTGAWPASDPTHAAYRSTPRERAGGPGCPPLLEIREDEHHDRHRSRLELGTR